MIYVSTFYLWKSKRRERKKAFNKGWLQRRIQIIIILLFHQIIMFIIHQQSCYMFWQSENFMFDNDMTFHTNFLQMTFCFQMRLSCLSLNAAVTGCGFHTSLTILKISMKKYIIPNNDWRNIVKSDMKSKITRSL